MLSDAAQVMLYNQKKYGDAPLFGKEEVGEARQRIIGLDYGKKKRLGKDVCFTLRDAGHILGSAFVEVEAEGKIIVFSGDVGNAQVPLMKETRPLGKVDYLVLESTYGDKIHESPKKRIYFVRHVELKHRVTSTFLFQKQ